MRDLTALDRYRMRGDAVRHWGWDGDETCGAFAMPSPIDGQILCIVASSGLDEIVWEHISVSRKNRTPNWQEMEHVRHAFAKPDETWVQFHVPVSDHINRHPHCLHLWHYTGGEMPRPPAILV
jgi:hypothetical protein